MRLPDQFDNRRFLDKWLNKRVLGNNSSCLAGEADIKLIGQHMWECTVCDEKIQLKSGVDNHLSQTPPHYTENKKEAVEMVETFCRLHSLICDINGLGTQYTTVEIRPQLASNHEEADAELTHANSLTMAICLGVYYFATKEDINGPSGC